MNNSRGAFRILNVLLVIGVVLLGVYLMWGFGTVTLPDQPNSGLYINDQFVAKNPKAVRLRPGTYTFRYTNTATVDVTETVKVSPFGHQTLAASSTPLDLTDAARTASGYEKGYFMLVSPKRFGDVWAASIVKAPSESFYLVMKYENGKWDSVYQGAGDDTDFSLVVPGDIVTYLLSLPRGNIGRGNGN